MTASNYPSGSPRGAARSGPGPELDELAQSVGREAKELISHLYPYCRSLTGNGVRQTLAALKEVLPLSVHEVPSGTKAYDWTVPDEWNIEDAYVADDDGRRIIDFKAHNLHVAGYSAPVDARMQRADLLAHLYTRPDRPDDIPYRHFYYRDGWGFCAPHRLLSELTAREYRVVIKSTIQPGHLTYGEFYIPGSAPGEILFSTHICHPSLCNDNLSGIATAALLARDLMRVPPRYGMRFLFVPATLGPLVWLSRNEHLLPRIRAGLVIAGVGDPGPLTYVRTRDGGLHVDKVASHVLARTRPGDALIREFAPKGYDQRQYCSPGFDLPIGCVMRTPDGEYPEYHTSADGLNFVTAPALAESWKLMRLMAGILQHDRRYLNTSPKGEPRLGPRGLIEDADRLGMFWTLNFSDGRHSLLDIAERSRNSFWDILDGARRLEASGLLTAIDDEDSGS